MARRAILVLTVAILAAACGTPDPSPTGSGPDASGSASPTGSGGEGSPGTDGITLPEPGQPYTGAQVLEAMRTSVRPDGVPDELETDAIAAAVAAELWTFDGDPWESIEAGGTCGGETCTLDVAGAPAGGAGDDVYTLSIDRSSGEVSRETTALLGYPESLEGAIDDVVRAGVDPSQLEGLVLAAATWVPPPDPHGRFRVAYRSGGEEQSPAIDVLVDVAAGRVLEVTPAAG
jgi:hypothetical protein